MVLRRSARLATALAASALLLTGCSTFPFGGVGGPEASSSASSSPGSSASDGGGAPTGGGALPEVQASPADSLSSDPASDPAYAAYYGQKAAWAPCEDYDGAQCATITVPKAWNDPAAGDIQLAILKVPAAGERTGSLLMNPGGPGGSGVSFVGDFGTQVVSPEVAAGYDLIGFDPRGVGRSTPIRCLDDATTDEFLSSTYDMSTPEGFATGKEWLSTVIGACTTNSRQMLGFVDTKSAARDMDVIRQVVGSDTLDYLGFSYGTFLGATYAELYPSRTGRLVLDGAIDPSLTGDQIAAGQADGFEKTVAQFSQWCLDQGPESCPLKGDAAQGVQQIRDFFDATDATPIQTSDPERPLTGSLARSGVLVGMYNDANWSYVAQGLTSAMNGDGTTLLALADSSSERDADGHYAGNGTYAITAVNCLDHPAVEDEAWMKQESARIAKEAPTFGPVLGYTGLACGMWPAGPMREPAEIHAPGSAPILVVGTTGDPATPYAWSQALAGQLEQGHLITWKGQGHTAYGRSGGCIEQAVDAYLLQGTVPEQGLTCDGGAATP